MFVEYNIFLTIRRRLGSSAAYQKILYKKCQNSAKMVDATKVQWRSICFYFYFFAKTSE